MPDWQEVVRHHLAGLALDEEEKAEVYLELAAHLEEDYEYSLAAGATESAAYESALRRVHDWHQLKCKIESSRKKEPPMNNRVSQFWLPAFITMLFTMTILMLVQLFAPQPAPIEPTLVRSNHWRLVAPMAVVYIPWLLTLPLIGALGAYLSGRAGASRITLFSSIISPTFPYLAFFLIGLPIAAILDDHVAHNIMIPAFLVGLAAWVILPAMALLAGGLLVRYFSTRLGVGLGVGS